eukprot:4498474-Amphidinium_carterae.1
MGEPVQGVRCKQFWHSGLEGDEGMPALQIEGLYYHSDCFDIAEFGNCQTFDLTDCVQQFG